MAGTHITLMAAIKGVPFPTVTWKKNEAEVPTRADIETNQAGTKLEMRFCHRGDCGDYTLTVENPAGSKTVTCTVLVLGEQLDQGLVGGVRLQLSFVTPLVCFLRQTGSHPAPAGV